MLLDQTWLRVTFEINVQQLSKLLSDEIKAVCKIYWIINDLLKNQPSFAEIGKIRRKRK